MATGSSVDQEAETETRHVTVDQIVAMNMRHWRRMAGMTQEELGSLIGWSAANVSAAERSADGDHERRRFDAGTLANLALAFEVPLIALFFPPYDDSPARQYKFPALPGDRDRETELDMSQLLHFLVLPDSGERSQIMNAYRGRFATLAESYLDDDWAKEVARFLSVIEDAERRSVRVAQLRARRAELLRAAEELGDLADAIDNEDEKP
jgi:transcriptional regulator with XRE-family HTH domain